MLWLLTATGLLPCPPGPTDADDACPGSRAVAADAHDARPLVANNGYPKITQKNSKGSAALAVAPFAKATLASYGSAESDTHRTHALGELAASAANTQNGKPARPSSNALPASMGLFKGGGGSSGLGRGGCSRGGEVNQSGQGGEGVGLDWRAFRHELEACLFDLGEKRRGVRGLTRGH